MEVEGQVENN